MALVALCSHAQRPGFRGHKGHLDANCQDLLSSVGSPAVTARCSIFYQYDSGTSARVAATLADDAIRIGNTGADR